MRPGEPVPYAGEDYVGDTGTTRAVSQYVPPTGPIGMDEPRTWQRCRSWSSAWPRWRRWWPSVAWRSP